MKIKNVKQETKKEYNENCSDDNCKKCSNFEKKYDGDDKIIDVYYDIIKSEYDYAFRKMESINSRAGFLITVLVAMVTFFYNNEKFISIIKSINDTLTIFSFFKYIICVFILIIYLIAIVYLIKCISIKNTYKFDIKKFDDNTLDEEKNTHLKKIINAYRTVIDNLNKGHIMQSIAYQKSLIFTFITLLLMIIFFIV